MRQAGDVNYNGDHNAAVLKDQIIRRGVSEDLEGSEALRGPWLGLTIRRPWFHTCATDV